MGNFNAGFIAFKNTTNGKNVLNFWKKKCLNWCFDIPDKSRYADQKYLNEIPKKFNKIQTKPSVGLNLAPWNIATNEKTLEIPEKLQKSLFTCFSYNTFFCFRWLHCLSNRILIF